MSDIALRFGAKDDGLVAQFRRVNKDIDQFEGNARRAATSIGSVFSAVKGIAAAAGLGLAIRESLQFADAVQNAADATKITAEGIQRLQFLGAPTGTSLDQITTAVGRMQKQLYEAGEGSKEARQAIANLGLETADFINLSPDERFTKVAQAIAAIEDPAEKTAIAMGLFGKGGQDLIPMLDAVGTSAGEVEARLVALGGPVNAAAIAAVDTLGDTLGETAIAAKSLTTELFAMIAPALTAGLEGLNTLVGAIRFSISGGNDPLVNLDDQIKALERQLEVAEKFDDKNERWRAHTRELRAELEALTRQQQSLLGFGEAGIAVPLAEVPINVEMPTGVGFEETAEDKAEREKFEFESRLHRLGIGLSREREQQLEHNLLMTEIDQKRSDDILRMTRKMETDRRGIITDSEQFLAGVRETFGLKQIEFEEIKNQSIYQLASGLFGALARENSKVAKAQQAIAIAQTIWSTATGVMKAFETLPWPASLGAAAKVVLTGALQVAKIKSTNYQGSSVSSSSPPSLSGGGGGTLATPTAPSLPEPGAVNQGQTTVYLSGVVTREVLEQLFEGLREGFSRDVVIIPSNSLQAQQLRNAA
jgi:hypothetical protein